MKKSFSFVLMGALGFSAAVGASSFGSSTTIDFNDIADAASVSGSKEDGFVFSAAGASFTDESDNDKAVLVTTTIGPFDNASFAPPPRPFFSIAGDEFELFQFTSVALGGSIFDLESADGLLAAIDVFGIDEHDNEVGASLSVFANSAGRFSADLFGLDGVSLQSLSFSSSTNAGTSATVASGSEPTDQILQTVFTEVTPIALTVDDIEVEVPSQVPVPASVFLLGSALIGGGVFARRKKKN